jgi:hypothetical protein
VSTDVCPSDPAKPLLEPEALQVTHTAYTDPSIPQAQNLVTGAGVKVAFLADGIDVNNPDLIRTDGSRVIVDFQDFTGEGPNAPTSGAEAFGDASSIAAQGRQTYDLATFVDPAHPLPAGCDIQIRGVAPGASLVALKIFGADTSAPISGFIQAIDYAVNVAGVDIINESFNDNPFPDKANDPVSLANNAAVDAGVAVMVSAGDSGTNGTVGTPSTSPKVIGVAATTTFRLLQQIGANGVNFSNGTWANGNISGLSSGGVTHLARVPDLAAPGDSGWALCSPDVALFFDCFDLKDEPARLQPFGGTSQSAPFVAGAAALVIQAYEKTHNGVRPSPALVKQLLTSTATDLGHPAFEQGAGELNSLAAVQAAQSWRDEHGSPAPRGAALVADQTQLSLVGKPGSTGTTSFSVRNVSGSSQTVRLSTRALGRVMKRETGQVDLNTASAPTFVDIAGTVRSFVARTFTVPAGADRLDVALAADSPISPPRVALIDPHGTYQAYSNPQGTTNFGHADVHFPPSGTWTAYFFLARASGFNGPIRFSITASDFTARGTVSPSTLTLGPGKSQTVTVRTPLPAQPGDVSTSVQLSTEHGLTSSVPLTLRSIVDVSAKSVTFTGVITGGNGRNDDEGVAQTNVYYLDVPAGKKDLGIGVTLARDPDIALFGTLTAPDGQVYSHQTNAILDAEGNRVNGPSLQIYRRDPQPGRWILSLHTNNPSSGLVLQQRFTATVAVDTVKVEAALPNSESAVLKVGKPVDVPVKITNTGVAPLAYFADGRLDTVGDIPLPEMNGKDTDIPLPVPPDVIPSWLVPPGMKLLTVAASATEPVGLTIRYNSGSPVVFSPPRGNGAIVRVQAAQVSPGVWTANIGQRGPFAGPAPHGSVSVAALAHGRLFDPAVTSSTGDVWRAGTNATPVTIAPGKSATITVTIMPTGRPGTVVRGHLNIDTFGFVTQTGDELIDLPYRYTLG